MLLLDNITFLCRIILFPCCFFCICCFYGDLESGFSEAACVGWKNTDVKILQHRGNVCSFIE